MGSLPEDDRLPARERNCVHRLGGLPRDQAHCGVGDVGGQNGGGRGACRDSVRHRAGAGHLLGRCRSNQGDDGRRGMMWFFMLLLVVILVGASCSQQ